MKIARKLFVSPDTKTVEFEEDVRSFWTGRPTGEKQMAEREDFVLWDTVWEEIQDFVNQLGPDKLINICEESHWFGHLGYWQKRVIVWYWTDDE